MTDSISLYIGVMWNWISTRDFLNAASVHRQFGYLQSQNITSNSNFFFWKYDYWKYVYVSLLKYLFAYYETWVGFKCIRKITNLSSQFCEINTTTPVLWINWGLVNQSHLITKSQSQNSSFCISDIKSQIFYLATMLHCLQYVWNFLKPLKNIRW